MGQGNTYSQVEAAEAKERRAPQKARLSFQYSLLLEPPESRIQKLRLFHNAVCGGLDMTDPSHRGANLSSVDGNFISQTVIKRRKREIMS